jgi:hypothetical protein
MLELLLQLVKWTGIVCGIACGMILVHSLLLFDLHRNADGYIRLAARRLKSFLITVFIVEWIIGTFLFVVSFVWVYAGYPVSLLFALMVGMLCASFPYALEQAVLPRKSLLINLQRFLIRLMLRLNLAVKYEFSRAIAIYRERDVFDCQSNGWNTGHTPEEVGRRLRILYELKKEEISMERGDPSFLYFDEGRNPWEKFYLLVRHLGRDELRRRIIEQPCPPSDDWDGRERRHRAKRGTKADRLNPGPDPERHRCYDNPDLKNRIRKRTSWFLPVKKSQ